MGLPEKQEMYREKYRGFIKKQYKLLDPLAHFLERWAIPVSLTFIILLLIVGVGGIVLKAKVNFDAIDITAPVDSVYYDRYLKYKDVFASNSTSMYQPQWAMDLSSMFLAVVMYPGNEFQRPIQEKDLTGINTMNDYFHLVDDYVSPDNVTYSQICARFSNKCVTLNMSEPFKEHNQKGSTNLLNLMTRARGRSPCTLDFPAQKATVLGSQLNFEYVGTGLILGSSKRGDEGLILSDCEKPVGKSSLKYNATCQYVGVNANRVEAIKYAWFLRSDTEEDREISYNWLLGIHENCENFARVANKNATGSDAWRFKCFSSIAPIEGGKEALKFDFRFVGVSIIISMLMPIMFMMKPCCENNFAPLTIIAVCVFWVTFIATIGIGSLLGLEIVYSLLVMIVFMEWFYLRLSVFISDSLKECLMIKSDDEDFTTVFTHWAPIIITTTFTLSITSFLACTCIYKLIWFTAAFLGIFFCLSCVTMLFVYFPIIARVLKLRNEGRNPFCMGRERDVEKLVLNNPLITQIKAAYKAKIFQATLTTKLIIVSLFLVFFLICALYSCVVLTADEGNESYYGYQKTDMFLPESEVRQTVDVMSTYYPDSGAGIQLIFNNKAKFHNDIGLKNFTACPPKQACNFHSDLIFKELFPALTSSPLMGPFRLSAYTILVNALYDTGEENIDTLKKLKSGFPPAMTSSMNIFNDVARLHVEQLPKPPYAPKDEGDPYIRMHLNTKFLTHTAQENAVVDHLEMAQKKLAETSSFGLANYFPHDSFEIYSPSFLMTESNRKVVSRTIFLPYVVIGVLLLVPLCSIISVPHPLAHAAIYINGFMLFVEFFAVQILMGTTLSNISMPYFFLLYLFAIEFSFYASHMNLKYLMMFGDATAPITPLPSPIPSIAYMSVALAVTFVVFVTTKTAILVAVRNCFFAFGVLGPLHEIFFIPSIMVLCVGAPGGEDGEKGIVVDSVNATEMKPARNGKATEA